MSKKMKLNLDDLKVQSFVTSLNKDAKNLFLGGEVVSELEQELSCCVYSLCFDNECQAPCGGGGDDTEPFVPATGAGDGCTGRLLC
jgi:hypothetical protein